MFLLLTKINTSHPEETKQILINSDAILSVDLEVFENLTTGGDYQATRIEIIGFPKYTIHTLTSYSDIIDTIGYVSLVNGVAGTGSTCAGDINVLDVVYPSIQYPFIEALGVFNNTITESRNYVFNTNYLVYAESVTFNDSYHLTESIATMIVLRDAQPKRIMTILDFNELVTLVNGVII